MVDCNCNCSLEELFNTKTFFKYGWDMNSCSLGLSIYIIRLDVCNTILHFNVDIFFLLSYTLNTPLGEIVCSVSYGTVH